MDARMQKRRMARWLGRLFVGLSFVTPWVAQAAVVTVPLTYEYSQGGRTLFTTTVTSTDVASCREGAMLRCEMENECWSEGAYELWHFSFAGGHGAGNCYYSGEVNSEAIMYATIRWRCALEGYWILGYNLENMTCLLDVPDNNLTITLTGGTEVEPSKGSDEKHLPITATVINQNTGQPPTTPVTVRVSLKVDPKTGGHDHGDNTRPRGGIDGTKCETDDTCKTITVGSGGSATITFNAPEASGTHTITATCDGCSDPATKQVNVKVDGLWPISDSTYYAFIGSTTEHNANHYVTSEAQIQLWLLAQAFYEYQLRNTTAGPTLLHLNDASLKWGGLFDIYADWVPDHYEHRRGSVVDIRANSNPGAIPAELTDGYIDSAIRLGIDPHLEYDGDPVLRHFHTRLLNRKE